jgi:cellulose synthase/poly-beta-1,6-N-acetylglucosamine synthase-like glycosyltransferase
MYCTLLDCGTIVKEDAIYNFFRAMEGDKQIGGVCGKILIKAIWALILKALKMIKEKEKIKNFIKIMIY